MDDEVIEAGKPLTVYDLSPDAFRKKREIIPYRVEKILIPYIIQGELVKELPTILQKKAFVKEQLEHRVWESELRPEMPHVHYVDLTEKVYETRESLYSKLHGGIL